MWWVYEVDSPSYKLGFLENGSLIANPKEVPNEVYDDLSSIVRYLRDGYGSEVFEPILENIDPKDRQDDSGKDWSELRRHQFASAFIDYTGIKAMNARERNSLNIRLIDELPIEVEAPYVPFGWWQGLIASDVEQVGLQRDPGDGDLHHPASILVGRVVS